MFVCYVKSRSGVEKALDVTRLSVYWNCASEADLLSTSVDSKALLVSTAHQWRT